ncbi:MAG TPA: DUF167 family protein [Turneriella sp.]|nr:DUF167 family protein [Turneriella sp.]
MQLIVHAKAGNKNPGIERISGTEWIVRVRERALDGKANAALKAAIAHELGIAQSCVQLVSGEKSKLKRFKIDAIVV